MRIKYFIFDLDDTLIAFDLVTEISWHQILSEYSKKNKLINYDKFYKT